MNVFIITWTLWCASEIFLNRLLHSGIKDKGGEDKGSLGWIWLIVAISMSIGIFISHKTQHPFYDHILISYLGLVIIFSGMFLRFFAIKNLGKYFTVDITIRENHRLVQNGLYKRLRHPSYSGSLLSFFGFGVSLNNWMSMLIILVIVFFAFQYRIRIEERMLVRQFGEEYTSYQKRSYKIIPWVY